MPEGTTRAGDLEASLRARLRLLTGVVAAVLLAALYSADLLTGLGHVSRGSVVAGVPIGGLEPGEAESVLRAALETRTAAPVPVVAPEFRGALDPVIAGLGIDWAATVAAAADRPLNPVTRVASFFLDRELDPVTTVDGARLSAELHRLAGELDRPPTEGSVRFSGLEPGPVDPAAGRRLDLPAADQAVRGHWWRGAPVSLLLVEVASVTTALDVRAAIDGVARSAVSGPVTVVGEGVRATLTPEVIASALRWRVDPASEGRLVPYLDPAVATGALRAGLAPSERPARDAALEFGSGQTTVVPSQDGRAVDYPATIAALPEALTRSGAARTVAVTYTSRPPKVTTEQLRATLPPDEMSSFSTGGFASDSGLNIRRAAQAIDGKVVEPGQTFSLNAATNPRDASNGYVEAGIIEDGQPARGIGGGVSQVATTLYNAAYFAGMTDVEHKEHSYYISRYPVAREATVFNDLIDVKFRNDGPGPVTIRTQWTSGSLTVRLLGTKTHQVSSTTGPRTRVTPPEVRTVSGNTCKASRGSSGFTATDTRTLRDLRTGQTRTETRTVVYNPSPTIKCKK